MISKLVTRQRPNSMIFQNQRMLEYAQRKVPLRLYMSRLLNANDKSLHRPDSDGPISVKSTSVTLRSDCQSTGNSQL